MRALSVRRRAAGEGQQHDEEPDKTVVLAGHRLTLYHLFVKAQPAKPGERTGIYASFTLIASSAKLTVTWRSSRFSSVSVPSL